jgi:hypothetical protein
MAVYSMDLTIEETGPVKGFLAQLESVPWFRNLGDPTPGNSGVKRIYKWEDWPGPGDPSVHELCERQQALYDDILREAAACQEQLLVLWDRIHSIVFRLAAPAVPYDPNQDSWHAPTAAVWQAAWTAGLIGLCLQSVRPIPPWLQEQWEWFVRGHWPSGYSSTRGANQLGVLLVY